MHTTWYGTIDDLGAARIDALEGSPVDFSHGMLRAVERTLWGDLHVRYIAVEEGSTLLGFFPVYFGKNIEFMAAMPGPVQRGYAAIVEHLGLSNAYGVAVAGSLISDRGYIPLLPGCDADAVVDRIIAGVDDLAAEHRLHLSIFKDIHGQFPQIGRFRRGGFAECYSLPTTRVDTPFASEKDYIASLTPNARSIVRRALKKVAQNYTLRYVSDYADLVPRFFPLMRATYLKAQFKLEEPPPRFFTECAAIRDSELLLIESGERIAGAFVLFWHKGQQMNKRIGIDYSDPLSPQLYNAINVHSLLRAMERKIPLCYQGQTAYTPKIRIGGKLEDQYLFIKGYRAAVRLSLPLQQLWMRKFQAERIVREVKEGA